MAATRRGSANTTTTASGTSHALNVPTGVKLDQLLVLIACARGSVNIDLSRSGWTSAGADQWISTGKIHVLWKKAAAAEVSASGGTLTFTTDKTATVEGRMMRFSDWHGTTAPETAWAHSYGSGYNPPSLNPSGWGAESTRFLAGVTSVPSISSYPANCTDDRATADLGNDYWTICSAVDADGSFDPDAGNLSGTGYFGSYTVALRSGTAGPEVDDIEVAQDPAILSLIAPAGQATGLPIEVQQDPVVLHLTVPNGQDTEAAVLRHIPLVGPTLDEPDRVDEDIAGLDSMVLPVLRRYPGSKPAWYDVNDDLGGGASLAVPTFVAAGALASGTGNVTPALYSGHTLNDIIMVAVQTANETAAAPAGYQQAGPAVGFGTAAAAGSCRLTLFWKRHDGSETDPTITDPGDHACVVTFGIRGCPTTGTPFESVGQRFKRTASTTATADGGATSCEAALVVSVFAHALDTAAAVFSAPTNADLTSVTEQFDASAVDGQGGGIGVITGVKTDEGTFTGTTVTMTSGTDVSSVLTFLPDGARPRFDRQVFVTAGLTDTWYRPSGAKTVELIGIGGGSSGSAGRNAATAAGGGGGGGGLFERQIYPADKVGTSVSCIVGAGGAATANSDGAASNAGTSVTVTRADSFRLLVANGALAAGASGSGSGGAGANGGGRSTAAAAGTSSWTTQPAGGGTGGTTAGAGGGAYWWGGGAGAGGGTTQAASGGGQAMYGGGGGGGGRSNTNVGTGGAGWYGSHVTGGSTASANGSDSPDPIYGGGGGAGGTSASGPGGSGGWPGGGGGGGGSQSGAQRGGAGGDGVLTILTYC